MNEQREVVLSALRQYLVDHYGQPPTLRQLMADTGLKSTSAVKFHVDELLKEGRVIRLSEDGKSLTRNLGVPEGMYILSDVPESLKWEVTSLVADESTILYLVKTQWEVEYFSHKFSFLSFLTTKIVKHSPKHLSLKHMVEFPAWLNERLDKDHYANYIQAKHAGVLPHGKIAENEGA